MVTQFHETFSFLETSVEKIASIDRGWLQRISPAIKMRVSGVEKIASIDRGWLRDYIKIAGS